MRYNPNKRLYTSDEFNNVQIPNVGFYVEHFIPTKGIVFVFGKSGSWKTPVLMQMMKAMAECPSEAPESILRASEGEGRGDVPQEATNELWGLRVRHASPLLWVQADMPDTSFQKRWKNLIGYGLGDKIYTYVSPSNIDIINLTHKQRTAVKLANEVIEAFKKYNFKGIFLDCLQTIQGMPINDQETTQIVYGKLKEAFPNAFICIIHHEHKPPRDPDLVEDDAYAFAGSQAWASQAQIGFRVKVMNYSEKLIRLVHTKSHEGATHPDIDLRMDDQQFGELANNYGYMQIAEALKRAKSLGIEGARELDQWLATNLGCSETTARRRRLKLQQNKVLTSMDQGVGQ